jgi:uncharacterized protein YijF (DUF1287 family)
VRQIIAAVLPSEYPMNCRIGRCDDIVIKWSWRMQHDELSDRFHEALAKAFAARTLQVRLAYFDLADFYRGKLENDFTRDPRTTGAA